MSGGNTLEAVRIEWSELGPLEPLASGGQAIVHRAPQLSLPDVAGPLVFKAYRQKCLPIPWVGLARLAKMRLDAPAKTRSQFDRYFTWPTRVVVENGETVGCVMQELDPRFFHDFESITGERSHKPIELQHLLVPAERLSRVGLPMATDSQRLVFCFEIARALQLLHGRGLIYGDISARNLLWSLHPKPTIAFVEGDALRRSGAASVVPQVETPDWTAPDRTVQSEATDQYKLGLVILRVLAPGKGSSTNTEPSALDHVLDREGRDLLRRALGTDRLRRPQASDWVTYFRYLLTGSRGTKQSASTQPTSSIQPNPVATVPRVPGSSVSGPSWVRRNGTWVPSETESP